MRRLIPVSRMVVAAIALIAASLAIHGCTGTTEKGRAPDALTPAVASASAPTPTSKCEYPTAPPDTAAVIQIRDDERALPCRIVSRTVLTLDKTSLDIDPALASVIRNSRGEYVVRGRDNVLGLLDSTGQLIRTFGRQGSGPGEFHSAVLFAAQASDTIYVFDMYQKRLTVIDPGLNKVVRTVPTPRLSFDHSFLLLPGSQLLVGGEGDSSFNTLRIMQADGSILRAFNVDTMSANRAARNAVRRVRELPMGRSQIMKRWLSTGTDGSVLVARLNSYIIEQWSSDFRLVRTFQRSVNWFPTLQQDQISRNPMTDSTPAQIYGVGTDSASGNIVVRILVTASEWKPSANSTMTSEGKSSSETMDPGDLSRYYDTIFDSFDARTGQLTASTRFPGTFGPVNNNMLFHTLRELPDGDVVIDIVKLELVANARPAK